jgi:hypothetical protein
MPETKRELTQEERLLDEKKQQEDGKRDEVALPGKLGTTIVFDCQDNKDKSFRIEHTIATGSNGSWSDIYKRVPERTPKIIKQPLLIVTQANLYSDIT